MHTGSTGHTGRSWLRISVAMAFVVTAITVTTAQLTKANGDFIAPAITVSAESSDDHPGMVRVSWAIGSGETAEDPTSHEASFERYLLQWATTGASPQQVNQALIMRRDEPFTSLVIPNLTADDYIVTISARPEEWRQNPPQWASTISAQVTVTTSAEAASMTCPTPPSGNEGPFPAGTPGLICLTPSNATSGANMNFVLYKGTQSGDLAATVGAAPNTFVWGYKYPNFPAENCDGEVTSSCNESSESQYFLARVNYRDRAGVSTTRWWGAFDDLGETFYNATQILVPTSPAVGPPVHLNFDLTEGDFITLEGELQKGTGQPLEKGVFENGTLQDPKDIVNPCVKVFNAARQFVNLECAFNGWPFSISEEHPGRWRMRLPRPTGDNFYRVYFVDRSNFDPQTNVLAYSVKFAPQWCGGDLNPSECTQAETFNTAAQFTTSASGLTAILRDAQQLRVTVSAVPNVFDYGEIRVYDEIAQRWTSGAMTVVTTEGETSTWGSNVTGLVQGRAYRIYFRFFGPQNLHRSWLVGGGDLATAPGVVPGSDLTEPWPNRPYAVTVHNSDGNLIEEYNSACVALIRANESVAASACNDGDNLLGSPGIVLLQRVVPGTYRAIAWRTGSPQSAIVVGTLEVPASGQEPFLEGRSATYAAGISNWTNQSLGALPSGIPSPTVSAVIIP